MMIGEVIGRAEFPEIAEYEIAVQKKGIRDEITLKIEPSREMAKNSYRHGEQALRKVENQDQFESPPPVRVIG